jgi:uncharacterized protein (DUF952 family)
MTTILHITTLVDWQQAQLSDSYHHPSLDSEGFIHCSLPQQVVKTANRFFSHSQNLILLFIESEQVKAEIRYEFGELDELFPHIYGRLNIDAVYQVINFEPGENGCFELPVEVADLMN